MRIVNLNPDTNIGASAWFVEMEGRRLLLDAGTHPKIEGRASLPLYKAIAHEDVEAVAISHCHHDHVGSLPVAVRHFPKAHVLLTEEPDCDADRVREVLSGNLCRCTGYIKIYEAVELAAARMRGEVAQPTRKSLYGR